MVLEGHVNAVLTRKVDWPVELSGIEGMAKDGLPCGDESLDERQGGFRDLAPAVIYR